MSNYWKKRQQQLNRALETDEAALKKRLAKIYRTEERRLEKEIGKSEREVTQSCPTLSDPMDCSLPGSSIHGIFQARVL